MKMKSIISVLAALSLVLLAMPGALAGDTGTYKILDYEVVLIPHSNGQVDIKYEQEWLVTGGHIPWVTVGTPNSNYVIKSFGGAAKSVTESNGGGWDGVRVDLNRDYQPQEKFRFNFTIEQKRLLEKGDNGGYKLRFIPGWYDRAITDDLTITLVSPAKVNELKTDPQPSTVSGDQVIWNKKNLGNGERFQILINFPNGTYNQTLMGQSGEGGGGDAGAILFILFMLGLVMFILLVAAVSSGSSDYGDSSSYATSEAIRRRRKNDKDKDDDDRYISPVIASGASKGSSGSKTSHSSGGGGGFGGRTHSCACACVSCACACACAGGGGAGCTKKYRHTCLKCQKGENENKKGDI